MSEAKLEQLNFFCQRYSHSDGKHNLILFFYRSRLVTMIYSYSFSFFKRLISY